MTRASAKSAIVDATRSFCISWCRVHRRVSCSVFQCDSRVAVVIPMSPAEVEDGGYVEEHTRVRQVTSRIAP